MTNEQTLVTGYFEGLMKVINRADEGCQPHSKFDTARLALEQAQAAALEALDETS